MPLCTKSMGSPASPVRKRLAPAGQRVQVGHKIHQSHLQDAHFMSPKSKSLQPTGCCRLALHSHHAGRTQLAWEKGAMLLTSTVVPKESSNTHH